MRVMYGPMTSAWSGPVMDVLSGCSWWWMNLRGNVSLSMWGGSRERTLGTSMRPGGWSARVRDSQTSGYTTCAIRMRPAPWPRPGPGRVPAYDWTLAGPQTGRDHGALCASGARFGERGRGAHSREHRGRHFGLGPVASQAGDHQSGTMPFYPGNPSAGLAICAS